MIKAFYAMLLLSVFSIHNSYSQQNDADKIKSVIIKEVDALNSHHNLEEYLSCFAKSEKIQVGPSNNKMTIGYEAVKANAQKVIANYNGKLNPNTWIFANWDIRVNGNTAFASCVQTTTTEARTFIDVFKSDYLEKVKGEWKIVDHRYFHAPERKE
ncbi:MAG: nuclear transport factor 2 family protein [Chitinophagaceae bacterium]